MMRGVSSQTHTAEPPLELRLQLSQSSPLVTGVQCLHVSRGSRAGGSLTFLNLLSPAHCLLLFSKMGQREATATLLPTPVEAHWKVSRRSSIRFEQTVLKFHKASHEGRAEDTAGI